MMTETERAVAAILADQDRTTRALTDSISAAPLSQLLIASEMLAKHLSTAPAGTTIRDLMVK